MEGVVEDTLGGTRAAVLTCLIGLWRLAVLFAKAMRVHL